MASHFSMPGPRPVPCMRCQEDLPRGSAYCPACGAPQLRVTEEEIEAAAAALAGTNVPRQPDLTLIQWKAAVYCALICGVAAGVLSSLLVGGLQFLLVVWTVGGALAAVALYSRRFPRAWIGGGVGLRIGFLCGLFGATVSTLLSALMLVVERYLFNQGAEIDNALNGMVKQLAVVSAQLTPAGQQNPYLVLVNGPEGHAILLVTAMLGTFFFTMLLSILGGAASGHYFGVKRRVQSSRAA